MGSHAGIFGLLRFETGFAADGLILPEVQRPGHALRPCPAQAPCAFSNFASSADKVLAWRDEFAEEIGHFCLL